MIKIKKILLLVVAAVIVLTTAVIIFGPKVSKKIMSWQADQKKESVLASFDETSSGTTAKIEDIPEKPKTKDTGQGSKTTNTPQKMHLKDQVNLDVQFIAQAPIGPGDAYWAKHAESCEEAASLMAHNFSVSKTTTMQQAEKDIWALVNWQKMNFGDEHDIYPEEVKQLLEGFWGHSEVRVIKKATLRQIKEQLSAGRPVIVPTIAAFLNNPHYYDRDYHMILAKGYTKKNIIAHDNGSTWGADYIYSNDQIMSALDAAGGSVVVIIK